MNHVFRVELIERREGKSEGENKTSGYSSNKLLGPFNVRTVHVHTESRLMRKSKLVQNDSKHDS